MAFKPLVTRNMGVDDNEEPVTYVEGTYETGDELPTDHIYQGSWALNLSDKSVVFFNGESWG